jgi:GTP-binding protein Era
MDEPEPRLRLGASPPGFRSGFVSLVGRPNVGKSTLLNQILRRKVAITSPHPQTTRNAIRGVLTTDEMQVVFVDTPGLHRPQSALGRQLNKVVRATLGDVDVVVFVLDVSEGIGAGDAFLAKEIGKSTAPVVVALNKADRVDAARLAEQDAKAAELGPRWKRIATSARTGTGVAELQSMISGYLPEGPLYYPPDAVTDQPEPVMIAELLREKLLEQLREEVPHSIAVVVDEMRVEDDLLHVDVTIYVERESQKGIVVGKGGRVLKQAGTRARAEIEALLGRRVFLNQRVKVSRDWQDRDGMAERFGYAT